MSHSSEEEDQLTQPEITYTWGDPVAQGIFTKEPGASHLQRAVKRHLRYYHDDYLDPFYTEEEIKQIFDRSVLSVSASKSGTSIIFTMVSTCQPFDDVSQSGESCTTKFTKKPEDKNLICTYVKPIPEATLRKKSKSMDQHRPGGQHRPEGQG
jgi:hypothetical protein